MLTKCANPACSAKFLYLHEGKLFAIESKGDPQKRGPPTDPEYAGMFCTREYVWLCSSCCGAMTIQFDRDHGISVIPKKTNSCCDGETHSDDRERLILRCGFRSVGGVHDKRVHTPGSEE